MKGKALLVLLMLAAVVVASGCIQETPTMDGNGDGGEDIETQQEAVFSDLDSDLIDESETIEIGELI
jgi:hypothetical protein